MGKNEEYEDCDPLRRFKTVANMSFIGFNLWFCTSFETDFTKYVSV